MPRTNTSYTIEVTLTVPAGKWCNSPRHECRFFNAMMNHPGFFCYIILESYWPKHGWDALYEKHPKCPSFKSSAKPMRGESPAVMKRLEVFKRSQAENTDNYDGLVDKDIIEDYYQHQQSIAAQTWHLFCEACHTPLYPAYKFCPLCGYRTTPKASL